MDNSIEDIRKAVLDLNKNMVEGFKVIDNNFETIEKRLDSIESNIAKLTTESTKGFDNVGDQITELKGEVVKIQKISGYSDQYENLLKIAR